MALRYENLDQKTREFMLDEVELDVSTGSLYLSPRLTTQCQGLFKSLLNEAIRRYDDTWLAKELRRHGCVRTHEQRHKPKGGFTTVKVPIGAAETLAEGEFNRFYIRGLCARALDSGISEVQVYRAKRVRQPRPESEALVGKKISARRLLADLRESKGEEPDLRIPGGPNSGLSVRLSQHLL